MVIRVAKHNDWSDTRKKPLRSRYTSLLFCHARTMSGFITPLQRPPERSAADPRGMPRRSPQPQQRSEYRFLVLIRNAHTASPVPITFAPSQAASAALSASNTSRYQHFGWPNSMAASLAHNRHVVGLACSNRACRASRPLPESLRQGMDGGPTLACSPMDGVLRSQYSLERR